MTQITMEFTGQIEALKALSSALFETNTPEAGTQKEIPGGTITMQPMMMRKAYGIPQFIEVVLSAEDNLSAGMASKYIYRKLTNHKGEHLSIRINRREIRIHKDTIAKMISQQIAGQSIPK